METSGKTPRAGTPKCMLPSRPRVGESPLPRKLRNASRRRHAAREVAGELAVERRADVVGPERVAAAARHALLAAAGVDRARDAALAVEHPHALLDQPVQQHEPEEREPVIARDIVRVVAGQWLARRASSQ